MTRWCTLPAYLVRTAGFAFGRLAALCCHDAALAEAVLDEAAAARRAAGHALDEALSQERYAEHPLLDDPAVRKQLSRQVKQVRAFARQLSNVPVPAGPLDKILRIVPRIAGLAESLAGAHARWLAAEHAFAAAFASDLERARGALHELYQDEALQEAVFLESPEAFERIQQLLATTGPRNARARQRERLAAMYAQRFCAKNDTHSMSGPHGIAYLTETKNETGNTAANEPMIEIAGGALRRETYFSHWAAQRLLDAAVERAGEAVRATLQLHPTARVDDDAVAWCTMAHDATQTFRRRYARSALPRGGAQLLRALVRPHTADELAPLANELALEPGELAAFLDELVEAGLLVRGPVLAPGLFHPLRAVADELARWPASDARAWALAEVAAVEALVEAFASGALAERRARFAELVVRFEAATGSAAARGRGAHYADRSLVHEDGCVAVQASLGPLQAALDDVLPALVAALELPLELARERVRVWFRGRYGEGVRVPALEVHRAFDEDRVFDLPASTARTAALEHAIARVRDAIARAASAAGKGPARLRSADLRDALAELPAPSRGGYLSADVLPRRLADGGVDLVLGEVHGFCWLPTCLLGVLPAEDRERVVEVMRAAVRDLAAGRPTAECLFLHTQATDRRFQIATGDLAMVVPSAADDAIAFGALDLRLSGDELAFHAGDREVLPLVAYTRYPFLLYTSPVAPLLDDFADPFFPQGLLPDALREGDAPRLVIDDVVVRRQLWRRPAPAVRAALAAGSEAELFRRAQALRRELGCGAQVFVSLSGEPKPVLLDFENVFLLEALVNLLERQPDGAVVRFSEMLPGPDELVAHGPDGLRTTELRMGFYRRAAP
jgi:hypothetical protein